MPDFSKNTWKSLSFRDKLSYIFAILSFVCGWIFTGIGFFMPPQGEVSNSVLWILGQALLFTGAVIGIAQYYQGQLNDFKDSVMNQIRREEDE
jgi:hypothetical protein